MLLLRRAVFDIDVGDEAWLHSLLAGFTEDEIRIIHHEIRDNICGAIHANIASLAFATNMYQYSWASTEGSPHTMRTSIGSSAGTPLADLMHVIAISKVIMSKFRDSFARTGSYFAHQNR